MPHATPYNYIVMNVRYIIHTTRPKIGTKIASDLLAIYPSKSHAIFHASYIPIALYIGRRVNATRENRRYICRTMEDQRPNQGKPIASSRVFNGSAFCFSFCSV